MSEEVGSAVDMIHGTTAAGRYEQLGGGAVTVRLVAGYAEEVEQDERDTSLVTGCTASGLVDELLDADEIPDEDAIELTDCTASGLVASEIRVVLGKEAVGVYSWCSGRPPSEWSFMRRMS